MKLKLNKMTAGRIAQLVGAVVIIAAAIAGTCVAANFAPMITTFISGTGITFDNEELEATQAQSDELCQEVAENGIVLLRNEDNALPLSTTKLNVFGWRATEQGFHLSGIGSGASTINEEKKVSFLDALTEEGFEYNESIIDFYNEYDSYNGDYGTGSSARVPFREPSLSDYSEDLLNEAKEYSDTALVVISRVSGENIGEIPQYQQKIHQDNDNSRHYLEITTEEEDLLAYCRENFSKVIVILNTSNTMELGFLETYEIDAALLVGLTGQSGALAIPRILKGEINPSGKTSDIYPYDLYTDPSYANYVRSGNHVVYQEDIYYGYKFYETAAETGYISDYSSVVQYPFGYGLSYTDFEWTLDKIEIDDEEYDVDDVLTLNKDSEVTLTFRCHNVGEVTGKDVMELYVTPPYTEGEIEKSSIQLLDFEKTTDINSGLTQTELTVSFTTYDLASYDAYDKNDNGLTTWEVDAGSYEVKFMQDSHTSQVMEEGSPTSLNFIVGNGSTDNSQDIIFSEDPDTGYTVDNRFTGEDAQAGVPIDGSTVYEEGVDYLSRANNFANFPTSSKGQPENSSNVSIANNWENTSYDTSTMPTLDEDSGLYLNVLEDGSCPTYDQLYANDSDVISYNYHLIYEIGADYDSETLDKLVDELTADEACQIVEDSGFGTPTIESIGKTRSYDFDGPAGFNSNTQTGITSSEWTAYPNQTLIGQTWSKRIAKLIGLSMGSEGSLTSMDGWYAPVVNLHRSPFNGRNYEMYSEDAVLSGKLAAQTINGAKANGVYCYVKHFGLTEPGQNSTNLNTWVTEQNLRENYFKAFEIAIKEGNAVAIMSSFSSIGGVWSGASYASNVEILRNEWGFKGSMITDWSMGSGNMNPHDGVRGGNDIWLNPNAGNNANKLDRSNATDVTLAKQSAKNVIYTFCNTKYYRDVEYDHSQDELTYAVGDYRTTPPFAWWIILLVLLDVVLIGGSLVWIGFTLFYHKKDKDIVTVEESKE